MRKTRVVMGMPATVELVGAKDDASFERVFALWDAIDARFSTYKKESEVMRINRREIKESEYSAEMREVIALAEKTKGETRGYFNVHRSDGFFDPSGVVKGWAILRAAKLADEMRFDSYYVEVGGDIQTAGRDAAGHEWTIGIRNPFKRDEIVKVLYAGGKGVATSGTAARGAHIYDPHAPEKPIADIVSITVIGPDVCEADRFATAAFAMGRAGVDFIEHLDGFAGYLIDKNGTATMTSDLKQYLRA